MVHLLDDWGASSLEYLMMKDSEEVINNKNWFILDLFTEAFNYLNYTAVNDRMVTK
jgi:hypothetical protein